MVSPISTSRFISPKTSPLVSLNSGTIIVLDLRCAQSTFRLCKVDSGLSVEPWSVNTWATIYHVFGFDSNVEGLDVSYPFRWKFFIKEDDMIGGHMELVRFSKHVSFKIFSKVLYEVSLMSRWKEYWDLGRQVLQSLDDIAFTLHYF